MKITKKHVLECALFVGACWCVGQMLGTGDWTTLWAILIVQGLIWAYRLGWFAFALVAMSFAAYMLEQRQEAYDEGVTDGLRAARNAA